MFYHEKQVVIGSLFILWNCLHGFLHLFILPQGLYTNHLYIFTVTCYANIYWQLFTVLGPDPQKMVWHSYIEIKKHINVSIQRWQSTYEQIYIIFGTEMVRNLQTKQFSSSSDPSTSVVFSRPAALTTHFIQFSKRALLKLSLQKPRGHFVQDSPSRYVPASQYPVIKSHVIIYL